MVKLQNSFLRGILASVEALLVAADKEISKKEANEITQMVVRRNLNVGFEAISSDISRWRD